MSAPLIKAAVRSAYGAPDVVRIVHVERPAINDDELLVKVHATTVNRTDCAYRSAKPFINRLFTGLFKPKWSILGTEFAGEVATIGSAVTKFSVGDRVFGFIDQGGCHAGYVSVPQDGSVAIIPSQLTYDQAAPGTEGSHYALTSIKGAKVTKDQDVLVNGATGGIGSAAVQLLKAVGANVTAVCGPENVDLVSRLGADRVIDYAAVDFTKDDQTYDVILDSVGKSSFTRCRRLLKPGGVYVSSELGRRGSNVFWTLVTPLLRGKKVKFPIPKQTQETVNYFKSMMESGEFRPVVDRRYPLDQIVAAYTYVETGQKIGNVVIDVAH